jgi:integrase/recombinase XerD
MNFSKALEGYFISMAADGYSQNTIELYRWGLELLQDFLEDPKVEDINKNDLQNFMAYLQNEYVYQRPGYDPKPLAPASIENIWISIRSFYNWARPELGLASRPDKRLKRPGFKPRQIVPFSEDEIKALLKATKTKKEAKPSDCASYKAKRPTASRDRAILLALLDTGLRVSELARLRIMDINLHTGEVHVMPYGAGRKTQPRTVYLGSAARKAVWRYLNEREETFDEDPVFLTRENRPMDRNSISWMVKRCGERAGVPNVHPHRFRHTFAIQFLRNGGDVLMLQRLLGHSSLEMIKNYVRLTNSDAQRAHRSASPVDRWRL